MTKYTCNHCLKFSKASNSCFKSMNFFQMLLATPNFTQYERKLRKFTGRLNSKTSIACTLCGSCIISYFNCLGSVKDVKWSCHGHITLFWSHHSVCLSNLRNIFCKQTNFSLKKTHYFKDELNKSIISTSLFYNSQKSCM